MGLALLLSAATALLVPSTGGAPGSKLIGQTAPHAASSPALGRRAALGGLIAATSAVLPIAPAFAEPRDFNDPKPTKTFTKIGRQAASAPTAAPKAALKPPKPTVAAAPKPKPAPKPAAKPKPATKRKTPEEVKREREIAASKAQQQRKVAQRQQASKQAAAVKERKQLKQQAIEKQKATKVAQAKTRQARPVKRRSQGGGGFGGLVSTAVLAGAVYLGVSGGDNEA